MSTTTFILGLCFCVVTFATPTSCAERSPPGLVVRLSLAGLTCAAEEGVKKLASQINGSGHFIPDVSESFETAKVSVRTIRVTDFVISQRKVSIDTGNGIFWRIEIARMSLSGFWDYTNGSSNAPYDDVNGDVDISAEGLHLIIKATLGIKSGDRPVVLLQNCSASVDKVTISGHDKRIFGGALEFMETTFRKKISDALCQTAGDVITKNAAAELETLKLSETVTNKFTVDYRLVEPPSLHDDFVQTGHSGEFRLTEQLFGPSFLPSELNLPKPGPSMVAFYTSEYVLNTLAEAMFKIKLFKAVITANDLPSTQQSALATVCNGTCFGSAFPQISRRYPNVSAVLELRATTRPVLTIRSDSANLKSELEMSFVIKPGYGADSVAVTLSLTGTATVTASVVGDKLVGSLLNISLVVVNITGNAATNDFRQSLTPDFDNLTRLLKIIGDLFIAPALNDAAANGFPLPILDDVHLVNSKLTSIPCAFVVSADFAYKP